MTIGTITIASDVMTTRLITLSPETSLETAMRTLVNNQISGAPVVDANGKLVGIFSEMDCLRSIVGGDFYNEGEVDQHRVDRYMSEPKHTVTPGTDIYRIAQLFIDYSIRRLPVVDGDELVGQISRRDVLRAVAELRTKQTSPTGYPDYPEGRKPQG